MGLREGVEKNESPRLHRSAAENQKTFIAHILKEHPELEAAEEYRRYLDQPTAGNAGVFIGAALDGFPQLSENSTYLDYIGTRPRVEKTGRHGLFSDEGIEIDLDAARAELNAFDGTVHTLIVSRSREDADETGFNCAARYRAFLRARKDELARQFRIPSESFRWFAAFHSEESHPHIHLLLYSEDPSHPGHLTQDGLRHIKRAFASEIFRSELDAVHARMTQRRDDLIGCAKEKLTDLTDPGLIRMMNELSGKLSRVSGRKVYAYLPPDIKELVRQIADRLCEDDNLKTRYDRWRRERCEAARAYAARPPSQKPLSEEETFRPILNAVIRAADGTASEETAEHREFSASAFPDLSGPAALLPGGAEDTGGAPVSDADTDSRLLREIKAKKPGIELKN